MGEKLYRPITKDGHHLIHSTENPSRVRGLSRDENNQNQDIPEWEEVDTDDLKEKLNTDEENEKQVREETTLTEEIVKIVVLIGGAFAYKKIIDPWWKNTAHPWLVDKCLNVKNKLFKEKQIAVDTQSEIAYTALQENQIKDIESISEQMDDMFENTYCNLTEEELNEHMMRLIFHMLMMTNEIRILSNSRMNTANLSEEARITQEKEVEKFLVSKVACNLNKILSNEKLHLGLDTSKEIFNFTGGGIRLNGEYVPVEIEKITEALKAMPVEANQHIKI